MKLELWVKAPRITQFCITIYIVWIYLPWNISNQYYPLPCTSSGCILHLCKVSSVSLHLLRRKCAYKTFGQTNRLVSIYPQQNLVCEGTINLALLYVKMTYPENSPDACTAAVNGPILTLPPPAVIWDKKGSMSFSKSAGFISMQEKKIKVYEKQLQCNHGNQDFINLQYTLNFLTKTTFEFHSLKVFRLRLKSDKEKV